MYCALPFCSIRPNFLHSGREFLRFPYPFLTKIGPFWWPHPGSWMPLTRNEQNSSLKSDLEIGQRKRKTSGNNHHHGHDRKRTRDDLCEDDENLIMGEAPKRANFSALTTSNNGFTSRASPLVNNKPGSSKKLVIKNFKGRFCWVKNVV